jgi:hypothetical protein
MTAVPRALLLDYPAGRSFTRRCAQVACSQSFTLIWRPRNRRALRRNRRLAVCSRTRRRALCGPELRRHRSD